MIGFVVDEQVKNFILDSIKNSQINSTGIHYWTTGAMPIFKGEYSGKWFIPFTDSMMHTVLRNNTRVVDFPEFEYLANALGGLDARVDVNNNDLVDDVI